MLSQVLYMCTCMSQFIHVYTNVHVQHMKVPDIGVLYIVQMYSTVYSVQCSVQMYMYMYTTCWCSNAFLCFLLTTCTVFHQFFEEHLHDCTYTCTCTIIVHLHLHVNCTYMYMYMYMYIYVYRYMYMYVYMYTCTCI